MFSALSDHVSQEFRATSAKVMAVMTATDFVVNQEAYAASEGTLAKIMSFIATMGMSKNDLPQELRSRLQGGTGEKPAPKAGTKAAAKKATKRRKEPVGDEVGEEPEPASKKPKADGSKTKKEKKRAKK